jgi:hypothetical protein
MPKTPPPRRSGSTRRSAPTKVSKPFPWGVVAGSVVLAASLIGLLVYAAVNQGGGRDPIITDPDNNISGITVAAEDELSRNHVEGAVDYPSVPPAGGDHNGAPQTCQVYTEAIAPEHAVHSLEHGAVWVTYNDSASDEDVEALTREVEGDQYRLMSPVPEQESPITLTAWGRTLEVDSADDERVDQFLEAYTNGPQTPEKGAACIGVTTTGPLPPAAPAETPAAVPSAAVPSAPASPAAQ